MSRRKTRGSFRVPAPAIAGSDFGGEDNGISFLPLLTSIAQSLANASKRGTGSKKKATTRKQTTPRRRALKTTARPATSVQNVETITLDDTPERSKILNTVQSKMGDFMQSASFLSSDEDEEKSKSSLKGIFMSDDWDGEVDAVSAKPSTSSDTKVALNDSEDIMNIVDTILGETELNKESKENPDQEMKNLEDFRKETERLLEDASLLLEQFKSGRKEEEPPKEDEKKEEPAPAARSPPSCPVCLECLSGRPAAATVCGHIFCKECITKTAKTLKTCPTCRKGVTLKKIHPIYL